MCSTLLKSCVLGHCVAEQQRLDVRAGGEPQPGHGNDDMGNAWWIFSSGENTMEHPVSHRQAYEISSCKLSSGRDQQCTCSCLNNAHARQNHHKSITDNAVSAVISQSLSLYTIALILSRVSFFLPHPDLFSSLKCLKAESCCLWSTGLAAVQYCMAWLQGHMLNRCGLCGISGWLHMLSDDKQWIRSDRS